MEKSGGGGKNRKVPTKNAQNRNLPVLNISYILPKKSESFVDSKADVVNRRSLILVKIDLVSTNFKIIL